MAVTLLHSVVTRSFAVRCEVRNGCVVLPTVHVHNPDNLSHARRQQMQAPWLKRQGLAVKTAWLKRYDPRAAQAGRPADLRSVSASRLASSARQPGLGRGTGDLGLIAATNRRSACRSDSRTASFSGAIFRAS